MALPIALRQRLSADDDPALWEQVLKVLAEDASIVEPVTDTSQLYAEVGVCSHWLRPHQTRWTAAGGFAWPVGYGGTGFSRTGLPLFDWSVRLQLNPAPIGWVIPEKLPTNAPFPSVSLFLHGRPDTAKRRCTLSGHPGLWMPSASGLSSMDCEI